MPDCTQVIIVVNSLSSPYTRLPNPIGVFTYPVPNAPLNITYNGNTGIPINTGTYLVSISVTGSQYCASVFTGNYSIVGKIKTENFALGWGNDIAHNVEIPRSYNSSPTGLPDVKKLVGGRDFSVALMSDNSVITWGTGNQYGQQSIPYVPNYIKDIYASNNTTFILDYLGNVTGCGYLFNTNGSGYAYDYYFSQYSNVPASIQYLTNISELSVSDYYVLGISNDATASITGWGEIRKSLFDYRATFGCTGISDISTSNVGCVLLSGDKVRSFGSNFFKQFSWLDADNNNIKKISCSDYSTVLLYNDKTVTGFGMFGDERSNSLVPWELPDPSIQGHVLDISNANKQTLFILDTVIPQPHKKIPACTSGIIYA